MNTTDSHGELSPSVSIEPYRVEWRANLTTTWLLMGCRTTFDEVVDLMDHSVAQWGGQARVVGQSVVMAAGIQSHAAGRSAQEEGTHG